MRITRAEYDCIIARAAAKVKKPLPLEKDIQREIEDWLKSLGNTVAWTRSAMFLPTTCQVGQPDFLVLWAGRFYAVEVKRPGQKAKPHQLAELHRWRTAGAIAGVAHSLADFKAVLGVGSQG